MGNIETMFSDGAISTVIMNSNKNLRKNLLHASFLQVENKSSETMKTNSMVSMLQAIRKKTRYTEDGVRCASAFSFNGVVYRDCTTTKTPDSQDLGKEWCYVEVRKADEKEWNWCRPGMDYDKIRVRNQENIKKVKVEYNRLTDEVVATTRVGESCINELKAIRRRQGDMDNKINQLFTETNALNDNVTNLQNSRKQWEDMESQAIDICNAKDKEKSSERVKRTSAPPLPMDTSTDTLKFEMTITNMTINPLLQKRMVSPSFDCTGMLNYESDPVGDGLNASYFNNENFLGKPVTQKDPQIEFDWSGIPPAVGIDPNNYSVRWQGFLYIPFTTRYVFSVESDDSVRVYLNGDRILKHKTYTLDQSDRTYSDRIRNREVDSSQRLNDWLNSEIRIVKNSTGNPNKSSSSPRWLQGGTKHSIIIEYSHSIHNNVKEDDNALINFYWSNESLGELIIDKRYFYTTNTFPPTKVGALDPKKGVIRYLLENDLAFKDSDKYILQDIPRKYLNLPCIKLNYKYTDKTVEFELGNPAIVYVGVLDHFPKPLKEDWESTDEYMSLLQIDEKATKKNPGKIVSDRSSIVQIYKKQFSSGKAKFELNDSSINKMGVPLILFYGPSDDKPLICGGEEQWISKPNSVHYERCSESSSRKHSYNCSKGLNGDMKDKEGSIWLSKGTDRENLEVLFKGTYEIGRIEFFKGKLFRPRKIVAYFSSGETFDMDVERDLSGDLLGENSNFSFTIDPPIKSSSVKFIIEQTKFGVTNGGAFKVYGTKCVPEEDLSLSVEKTIVSMFAPLKKDIINLTCRNTLIDGIDQSRVKVGARIKVRCNDSCSLEKRKIYGSTVYSANSVICKSAYHSGILKEDGGVIEVLVIEKISNYEAKENRGIKSRSNARTDVSMRFEESAEGQSIGEGSKLDIQGSRSNWLKGIVSKISGNIFSFSFEDSDATPMELTYPNAAIRPCGEKIKDRDCSGSRNANNPVTIKFAPSTFTKQGNFEIDSGQTYGSCNKGYGWSRDMSRRMKHFNDIAARDEKLQDLETYVEFGLSPSSQTCRESSMSPSILCDNVDWSIKVGFGKFKVRIKVGSSKIETTPNLQVNGEPISPVRIRAGELKTLDITVESQEEKITITAECETCNAATLMNTVTIERILEEDPNQNKGSSPAVGMDCNNTIKTGCDASGGEDCAWETAPALTKCDGVLTLMIISNDPAGCPKYAGWTKCVRRKYDDSKQCKLKCPGTCSNRGECS